MTHPLSHSANTLAEARDDLQSLSQTFALPPLNYIDISSQERLTQMMNNWPLLAELAQDAGSH